MVVLGLLAGKNFTHGYIDRQTDRQAGRKAGRQAGRQATEECLIDGNLDIKLFSYVESLHTLENITGRKTKAQKPAYINA